MQTGFRRCSIALVHLAYQFEFKPEARIAGDPWTENRMTTETIRSTVFPTIAEISHGLGRLVSAMAAGSRAASDWERLSRMSDSQLARQGLTREAIGRRVFERHFA